MILQDIITNDIEKIEKKKKIFKSKTWSRGLNQGGGEFRIFENGRVFEKVGVNFSEVYGKFPRKFKGQIPGTIKNLNFWASGISVVMHMKNPHIPAMHFNTRYIVTSHGWFGGGMDVTPCLKDINFKNWIHNEIKKTCNKHNKNYYKKYKKWCEKYFYLPHRNEERGIGGIFFDYKKGNWEKDFAFVRDVGLLFTKLFNETIKKKRKKEMDKETKRDPVLKKRKIC